MAAGGAPPPPPPARQDGGTHKGGVCQDDLRLVGEDVELDDVAVAVPVDDLGVCGGKRERKRRENVARNEGGRPRCSAPPLLRLTAPSAPLCVPLKLTSSSGLDLHHKGKGLILILRLNSACCVLKGAVSRVTSGGDVFCSRLDCRDVTALFVLCGSQMFRAAARRD